MKLLQDGEETGDVEENERYERCLLNSKEGESRWKDTKRRSRKQEEEYSWRKSGYGKNISASDGFLLQTTSRLVDRFMPDFKGKGVAELKETHFEGQIL